MRKVALVGNGYIGREILRRLEEDPNIELLLLSRRMLSDYSLPQMVEGFDYLINAAGWGGSNSVDDCEREASKTFDANTTLAVKLAEVCRDQNIRMIHISSGCIFTSGDYVPITEDMKPDLIDCVYRRSKISAEETIKDMLPDAIILRIRMPFDGRKNPRNLLIKVRKYRELIAYPNSMTNVGDLADLMLHLIEHNTPGGIYNAAHPDPISLPDIARLDDRVSGIHGGERSFRVVHDLETLVEIKRSDVILNTSKLSSEGFTFSPIREAIKNSLIELDS